MAISALSHEFSGDALSEILERVVSDDEYVQKLMVLYSSDIVAGVSGEAPRTDPLLYRDRQSWFLPFLLTVVALVFLSLGFASRQNTCRNWHLFPTSQYADLGSTYSSTNSATETAHMDFSPLDVPPSDDGIIRSSDSGSSSCNTTVLENANSSSLRCSPRTSSHRVIPPMIVVENIDLKLEKEEEPPDLNPPAHGDLERNYEKENKSGNSDYAIDGHVRKLIATKMMELAKSSQVTHKEIRDRFADSTVKNKDSVCTYGWFDDDFSKFSGAFLIESGSVRSDGTLGASPAKNRKKFINNGDGWNLTQSQHLILNSSSRMKVGQAQIDSWPYGDDGSRCGMQDIADYGPVKSQVMSPTSVVNSKLPATNADDSDNPPSLCNIGSKNYGSATKTNSGSTSNNEKDSLRKIKEVDAVSSEASVVSSASIKQQHARKVGVVSMCGASSPSDSSIKSMSSVHVNSSSHGPNKKEKNDRNSRTNTKYSGQNQTGETNSSTESPPKRDGKGIYFEKETHRKCHLVHKDSEDVKMETFEGNDVKNVLPVLNVQHNFIRKNRSGSKEVQSTRHQEEGHGIEVKERYSSKKEASKNGTKKSPSLDDPPLKKSIFGSTDSSRSGVASLERSESSNSTANRRKALKKTLKTTNTGTVRSLPTTMQRGVKKNTVYHNKSAHELIEKVTSKKPQTRFFNSSSPTASLRFVKSNSSEDDKSKAEKSVSSMYEITEKHKRKRKKAYFVKGSSSVASLKSSSSADGQRKYSKRKPTSSRGTPTELPRTAERKKDRFQKEDARSKPKNKKDMNISVISSDLVIKSKPHSGQKSSSKTKDRSHSSSGSKPRKRFVQAREISRNYNVASRGYRCTIMVPTRVKLGITIENSKADHCPIISSVDSEGLLSGLVHSGDRFLEVDAENVSQMDCTGLSNLIKMKGKQKTNADEIEIVVFSYQSAPPVHMLES